MNRTVTLLMLSLILAVAAPAQESQPKPETKAPEAKPVEVMPTIDQILDKFIQALGGKAAIEKLTSRVSKGTMEVVTFGVTGSTEIYAKAPNKYLLISEFPDYGLVKRAFDGTIAWSQDPQSGLTDITGPPLAAVKRSADFYRNIKIKELYPQATIKGKEKVGDREAYVIEVVPDEGGLDKMYFDATTGLLISAQAERERPEGRIRTESQFEDYRDVDGVKLPFTIRETNPNLSLILRLSEIKHNVPIEDAKFSKPTP